MTRSVYVAALIAVASSHGAMQFPLTRNVYKSNYCPQCANGAGVCGEGASSQWTTSTEPADLLGSYLMPERTKLIAGGKVEVELYFTAAHMGLFVIELCANPGSVISDDCFVRLERDPTDTELSPYIEEYPHIFYLPENSCATSATAAAPMKARFLVPEGVESDLAILRWYWNSGNSCAPNELSAQPADSRIASWEGTFNGQRCKLAISGGSSCGSDCPNMSCHGEAFRNCADVAVVAGDTSTVVTSSDYETTTSDVTPNATNKPSAATSNGAQPPSTGCGSDWASQVAACQAAVTPLDAWNNSFCQDACSQVGTGAEPSALAWCEARGLCTDLSQCVAAFWANVCTV